MELSVYREDQADLKVKTTIFTLRITLKRN